MAWTTIAEIRVTVTLIELEDGNGGNHESQVLQAFLLIDEYGREQVVVDEESQEERTESLPHDEYLAPVEADVAVAGADGKTHDWCEEQQGPKRQVDNRLLLMFFPV